MTTIRLFVACLAVCAITVRARADTKMTLDDIIANVHGNERLYENIDATLSETDTSSLRPKLQDPNIKVSSSADVVVHFVGQDGMFRAEATKVFTMLDGKKQTSLTTRVFDNHITKSLVSGHADAAGNVNIIKGRADDQQIVRPHMMLMRMKRTVPPLSAYLRGEDAIRSYPYGSFSENISLSVEYKGETDHKGLHCHLVELTHRVKKTGALNFRAVLWLAEDKNYIPVRREGYDYLFSGEIPISEGEVSSWREIKTGVWFPYVTEISRYDDDEVKKNKRKKLTGSWKYEFDSVSLDPKFELAYFQDLKIPNGSAIYEVEDKKIIRSYREGQPETGSSKLDWSPVKFLLLWGNVAIIGIMGTIVARKRFRQIKNHVA